MCTKNQPPLPSSLRGAHVHVVGVAGVGMSALAQALAAHGAKVSGSDRHYDRGRRITILDQLQTSGIDVVRQDGSGVRRETFAVVVSTAIESDNPDLVAASRFGVPVLHRADLLAGLCTGRRCIAIAGTCGKSTITGMVGWILDCAGWDPFVVNGAGVLNWRTEARPGNVRIGAGDSIVIEADESDRTCLKFHPDSAIISNAFADHFDLGETLDLFDLFAAQVSGPVVRGYGDSSVLADFAPRLTEQGSCFECGGVEFTVPMQGLHNAENARLAVELCRELGVSLQVTRDALASFKGLHRRLEHVGVARGVTVIDDYAHNPAKIAAAWQAAGRTARRVCAVWRPHGYGPLRKTGAELVRLVREICGPEDMFYVLPVYDDGGTAERTVSSEDLVADLRRADVSADAVDGYPALEARLLADTREGDVVLTMGARDPELPVFATRLFRLLNVH